jgi:hypothetical protein
MNKYRYTLHKKNFSKNHQGYYTFIDNTDQTHVMFYNKVLTVTRNDSFEIISNFRIPTTSCIKPFYA